MRGREPIAIGINNALPLAIFILASHPEDIMLHHLQGQRTIMLVDSVVNSGKMVVQFMQYVRNLHATVCIVVGDRSFSTTKNHSRYCALKLVVNSKLLPE